MTSDVVVIGAGSIGISVALELARRGAAVTVLERGAGVAAGCSAGNAGIVGAAHVLPLPSGPAVREGLSSLTHAEAPFSIRPSPSVLPWLRQFVAASRPGRYATTAALLHQLATRSAQLHVALSERFDVGYVQTGFLEVYEHPDQLRAAGARAIHENPLARSVDGGPPPGLSADVIGGVLHPDTAHVDPVRFVTALAEELIRIGGRVRAGVEVLGVRTEGGRVTGVTTSVGDLTCASVVLATGAWSPELSRSMGVRLPVQGGKGYAIEYAGSAGIRQPVYSPTKRIVLTPLADRVRLTGMLELCGTDLSIDERRVATLRRQGEALAPRLAGLAAGQVWRGLRPCSPDGLPILGPVPGLGNAWLATGHGMWGLQLAPITGALLGGAIAGEPADALLAPLSVMRFGAASCDHSRFARSRTLVSRKASSRTSGSERSRP